MSCTAEVCARDTSVLCLGCGVNRILFYGIPLWLRSSWAYLGRPRDGGTYPRAFLGIWRTQLDAKCVLVDEMETVVNAPRKFIDKQQRRLFFHMFISGLVITSETLCQAVSQRHFVEHNMWADAYWSTGRSYVNNRQLHVGSTIRCLLLNFFGSHRLEYPLSLLKVKMVVSCYR